LLAIRQVFNTRVASTAGQSSAEPPKDQTLLNEILSSDSKVLKRLSQATSKTCLTFEQAANEFVLGLFMSLNQSESHPDNLCTGLLRFLDRKSDANSDVYLKAMSEYLKILPDNFDLDMEVEHLVQVIYSHRTPADQQRIVDELSSFQ
jgi:hypothetical protein